MFLTSYVILLNIIYGFSIFTLIQLLSYYTILLYNTYNIKRVVVVSVLSMWIYIPFVVPLYGYDLLTYFISDIPFTIVYTANNIILYILLYERLNILYETIINKTMV